MCPVSGFSAAAIRRSLPVALMEVETHSQGKVNAERIWTTCLAVAALGRIKEHYAVSPGEGPGQAVTLTDRATKWLWEQAVAHPPLAPLMPRLLVDSALLARAWQANHKTQLAATKMWEASRNRFRTACETQRAAGHILLHLIRGHGAAAMASRHPPAPVAVLNSPRAPACLPLSIFPAN